jgi:8-amino-7-oxononanoate synthase
MTARSSPGWESNLSLDLPDALADLRARDLYRRRRTVQHWPAERAGAVAIVDDRERLVFCSNDYLGLAHHPRVIEAFREGARSGVGSGASHLVTGHSAEHQALEEELAAFTGRERALLFSTGYMANLGVVAALAGRGDEVLEDRLNHASLLDAALLSGARFSRYPHLDSSAVEARFAQPGEGTRLAVTDGVFSMDGDVAPLEALAASCARHGAWLMVDDAHGLGVLGATGRGTLEHFGLPAQAAPILMGTLGKALGTFGAFVAGSGELIEYLIQKARTYIYTTALPPAVAAATRAALRLVDAERWRCERVTKHVARFRDAAASAGLELGASQTPIQPLILGSAARALHASDALWERGIWVTAIRTPTVPEGSARLRITLSASHSEEDIARLVEALASVMRADA